MTRTSRSSGRGGGQARKLGEFGSAASSSRGKVFSRPDSLRSVPSIRRLTAMPRHVLPRSPTATPLTQGLPEARHHVVRPARERPRRPAHVRVARDRPAARLPERSGNRDLDTAVSRGVSRGVSGAVDLVRCLGRGEPANHTFEQGHGHTGVLDQECTEIDSGRTGADGSSGQLLSIRVRVSTPQLRTRPAVSCVDRVRLVRARSRRA